MKKLSPTTGVLIFYATLLTLALLVVLAHCPPSAILVRLQRKIDLELVEANRQQLAWLAAQTRLYVPGTTDPTQVTWTFESPCGDFLVLAMINQWRRDRDDGEPETLLAGSLGVQVPPFLRRPGTTTPPRLTLSRFSGASDLVPRQHPRRFFLGLELLSAGSSNDESLVLNNLLGGPGATSATVQGEELSWATSAHCRFQPRDLRLFSLLAQLVRARICDGFEAPESACYDTSLLVYRDTTPDVYHLDLQAAGTDLGQVSMALSVRFDARDKPLEGDLSLLGATLRSPAQIFFTRPHRPGELHAPEDEGFYPVRYEGFELSKAEAVSFTTLLAGSGWEAETEAEPRP